jgi:hypothetical protein
MVTDVLDRKTEEVLDTVRQHIYRMRCDADELEKSRAREERLWECLTEVMDCHKPDSYDDPACVAVMAKNLPALCIALGVSDD